MLNRKVKHQIDAAINELDMNLANNYKDLARDALKVLESLVVELYGKGEIKYKDYEKLQSRVNEYKTKMIGYHH